MTTSQSLYNAINEDNIDRLSPGSILDYGFFQLNKNDWNDLFSVYKSILKSLGKTNFISTMHTAFINENIHETIEKLTRTLPEEDQIHWNTFISKNYMIEPVYI